MKLETIYKELNDYMKTSDFTKLLRLKEKLEQAVRDETAYKTTSKTRVSAIKKIASHNNVRPALTGYGIQNGYQVVTDSYHLIAIHQDDMPLQLVATADELKELNINLDEWREKHGDVINAHYPDVKSILNYSDFEELAVDKLNMNDITQFIKLHDKTDVYEFNGAYYQPQFIKNVVDVIGKDFRLFYKNNTSPLYFVNDNNEIGLVLPVRKY